MNAQPPSTDEPTPPSAEASGSTPGDGITKAILGCGCFTFVLAASGLLYAIVHFGFGEGGGLDTWVKVLLAALGIILFVILAFFLMRLDMVMARFRN